MSFGTYGKESLYGVKHTWDNQMGGRNRAVGNTCMQCVLWQRQELPCSWHSFSVRGKPVHTQFLQDIWMWRSVVPHRPNANTLEISENAVSSEVLNSRNWEEDFCQHRGTTSSFCPSPSSRAVPRSCWLSQLSSPRSGPLWRWCLHPSCCVPFFGICWTMVFMLRLRAMENVAETMRVKAKQELFFFVLPPSLPSPFPPPSLPSLLSFLPSLLILSRSLEVQKISVGVMPAAGGVLIHG